MGGGVVWIGWIGVEMEIMIWEGIARNGIYLFLDQGDYVRLHAFYQCDHALIVVQCLALS